MLIVDRVIYDLSCKMLSRSFLLTFCFCLFAVGMSITSDIRYVVSASSKIIIFDLNTGEVFRTINPGIDGIVSALSISPNDKYCICSTSFNQVVICNIQTGDYQVLQPPVEKDDGILGRYKS